MVLHSRDLRISRLYLQFSTEFLKFGTQIPLFNSLAWTGSLAKTIQLYLPQFGWG